VAIKGLESDGHQYIDQAIEKGASVIVHQQPLKIKQSAITYIQVENSAIALAYMAANFYEQPSKNLNLIGVTGTNGKTTVSSLLYDLFKAAGYKVGLLSTVKILVDDQVFPATHTTPNSIAINRYLKQMSDVGVEFCFMEVSSHGIDQYRTEALEFKGGIFTNLTHDHLDYHKTFSAYRDVKKSFFDQLPKSAFSLVNLDDKNGRFMVQNSNAKLYSYALKTQADYRVQILENQLKGLLLKINDAEVWAKLIGEFNAYNLAAIFACADILGLESNEILRLISTLESVSGRFEFFITGSDITVIVDYAHTPDALKNILQTINAIRTKNETLITVVGCGGDRDKTKRPKMGHIASLLSNKVILTSDNPRSENPEHIITEMEQGVEAQNYNKIISITNRTQAIKTACQLANANDIILLAGKGHENYQEIKGEKIHFSDFEVARKCLNQLQK
jgi:UDP-N-acetylmuramoyl-L-alanyl-D-glutamate--2,6-diaminopimelate ligase